MDVLQYTIDGNEVSPDGRYKDFNSQLLKKEDADKADLVMLGVPYDPGTPKHVGANQGPMGIRQKLSFLRTYSCEFGIDIMDYMKVCDIGNADTDINDPIKTFDTVDKILTGIYSMKNNPKALVLGGDHSVSPQNIASFCSNHLGRTGLIWFDNHLDTMESYHGDKWYCGCPLYRILTENENSIRGEDVVIIGPRGFHHSPQMWEIAKQFGVTIITAEQVRLNGIKWCVDKAKEIVYKNTNQVYVSFDIDVADPAFAPGTQSPCPGGLLTSELMYAVRTLAVKGIDAMDIVEVTPIKDIDGRTCMLAASIALEFMAGDAMRRKEGLP